MRCPLAIRFSSPYTIETADRSRLTNQQLLPLLMTDEQIENLSTHVNIKVGNECPACGQDTRGEWTHLEEVINEEGEQPLVGVFCPNCYNTLLFPARYVGIGL